MAALVPRWQSCVIVTETLWPVGLSCFLSVSTDPCPGEQLIASRNLLFWITDTGLIPKIQLLCYTSLHLFMLGSHSQTMGSLKDRGWVSSMFESLTWWIQGKHMVGFQLMTISKNVTLIYQINVLWLFIIWHPPCLPYPQIHT